MKKISLKFKLTLVLSLLMATLVFLSWFANDMFLEKYYINSKTESLSKIYNEISALNISDYLSGKNTDISNSLEKIEANGNVSIYLIAEARNEFTGKSALYFAYPLEIQNQKNGYSSSPERYNRIIHALQLYIFSADGSSFEVLKTDSESFDIYKYYDSQVSSSYIDLVGNLDNDCIIFIRSNYSNISEASSISNKFLAITGVILLIIGSILMFLFSYSISKPVKKLSEISKAMSELNFESRYTGKHRDEIGELGKNINLLSDKLENTISELRSANIQLEKDIEKKNETDNMRREFLSNVSHELKTPIALIQGYAEGLADNVNDDEESRKFYCDVIIDEAQKMNNMVKKLLSLNEIEFGNSKLELERFDIIELVRSIASSFDIVAKQSMVALVLNDIKPVYVWADQYLIEEVVSNYLSNAIHYVKNEKIVDISFRTSDDKIRISVFNTGDCIPEDDLARIWDKFYKVDKARTREYGGSGIGLSIVKAILDSHNEKFGVNNHSNGVEFWFELTIAENSK